VSACVAIPRLPDEPVAGCRNHSAGRSGAVPSVRGTAGRARSWWPSTCRASGAWRCVSWSVGVLDSASSRSLRLAAGLQRSERGKPRIFPDGCAGAPAGVQVRAAL